jgi:hypothetical protein
VLSVAARSDSARQVRLGIKKVLSVDQERCSDKTVIRVLSKNLLEIPQTPIHSNAQGLHRFGFQSQSPFRSSNSALKRKGGHDGEQIR